MERPRFRLEAIPSDSSDLVGPSNSICNIYKVLEARSWKYRVPGALVMRREGILRKSAV